MRTIYPLSVGIKPPARHLLSLALEQQQGTFCKLCIAHRLCGSVLFILISCVSSDSKRGKDTWFSKCFTTQKSKSKWQMTCICSALLSPYSPQSVYTTFSHSPFHTHIHTKGEKLLYLDPFNLIPFDKIHGTFKTMHDFKPIKYKFKVVVWCYVKASEVSE